MSAFMIESNNYTLNTLAEFEGIWYANSFPSLVLLLDLLFLPLGRRHDVRHTDALQRYFLQDLALALLLLLLRPLRPQL